jgi:hypothetical protein
MQRRDWIVLAAMIAVFAVVTTMGMVRVWYNTQELHAGVRLESARKELQKAETENVRLGLVRSWMKQPDELRDRAEHEAGLTTVPPSRIVPIEKGGQP